MHATTLDGPHAVSVLQQVAGRFRLAPMLTLTQRW
jgi:hypothetical protein